MASVLLALACGVAAGGCQVIAGLTVLEVTTSTSGSSGGSGGIAGVSSTGGQGGGCNSACANGEPCHDGTACQSGLCAKSGGGSALGICTATKALGIGCTADDECGSGYCTDGVCCTVDDCKKECLSYSPADGMCKSTVGLLCGAKGATPCSAADTCDAVGNCRPR